MNMMNPLPQNYQNQMPQQIQGQFSQRGPIQMQNNQQQFPQQQLLQQNSMRPVNGQPFNFLSPNQQKIQHSAQKPGENSDILELLSMYIAKAKDDEPSQIQQVENGAKVEDNDDDHWWSGFLTRSKQHRLGVDMTLIRQNKEIQLTDYHLNITHRAYFEEVFRKEPVALVLLMATNEINKEQFEGYVKYFTDKQRAGVVQTANYFIYVLPKCEYVDNIYNLKQNQMLGVFVENNTNPNQLPMIPTGDKKYDIYQIDKPYQVQQSSEKQIESDNNDNADLLNNLLNSIDDI